MYNLKSKIVHALKWMFFIFMIVVWSHLIMTIVGEIYIAVSGDYINQRNIHNEEELEQAYAALDTHRIVLEIEVKHQELEAEHGVKVAELEAELEHLKEKAHNELQ